MNEHTLLNNVMPCIIVDYEVEYFVIVVLHLRSKIEPKKINNHHQLPCQWWRGNAP